MSAGSGLDIVIRLQQLRIAFPLSLVLQPVSVLTSLADHGVELLGTMLHTPYFLLPHGWQRR